MFRLIFNRFDQENDKNNKMISGQFNGGRGCNLKSVSSLIQIALLSLLLLASL